MRYSRHAIQRYQERVSAIGPGTLEEVIDKLADAITLPGIPTGPGSTCKAILHRDRVLVVVLTNDGVILTFFDLADSVSPKILEAVKKLLRKEKHQQQAS